MCDGKNRKCRPLPEGRSAVFDPYGVVHHARAILRYRPAVVTLLNDGLPTLANLLGEDRVTFENPGTCGVKGYLPSLRFFWAPENGQARTIFQSLFAYCPPLCYAATCPGHVSAQLPTNSSVKPPPICFPILSQSILRAWRPKNSLSRFHAPAKKQVPQGTFSTGEMVLTAFLEICHLPKPERTFAHQEVGQNLALKNVSPEFKKRGLGKSRKVIPPQLNFSGPADSLDSHRNALARIFLMKKRFPSHRAQCCAKRKADA